MSNQIIEIEADTLKEARAQAISQIPKGFCSLSEKVISDGRSETIIAAANTIEAAFAQAQNKLPVNAIVLEKNEVTAPGQKVISVEAFDEPSAKAQIQAKIGNTGTIQSLKLTTFGKKGFLGLGKTPHQYEADILQQAIVKIIYKQKAKVSIEIGEPLEHAIIWDRDTQLILTDISRSKLKERILGSDLAFILDIKDANQADEFCSKGRTETTDMLGRKRTVTLEWCNCSNPASHKRPGVTQLGS